RVGERALLLEIAVFRAQRGLRELRDRLDHELLVFGWLEADHPIPLRAKHSRGNRSGPEKCASGRDRAVPPVAEDGVLGTPGLSGAIGVAGAHAGVVRERARRGGEACRARRTVREDDAAGVLAPGALGRVRRLA